MCRGEERLGEGRVGAVLSCTSTKTMPLCGIHDVTMSSVNAMTTAGVDQESANWEGEGGYCKTFGGDINI